MEQLVDVPRGLSLANFFLEICNKLAYGFLAVVLFLQVTFEVKEVLLVEDQFVLVFSLLKVDSIFEPNWLKLDSSS